MTYAIKTCYILLSPASNLYYFQFFSIACNIEFVNFCYFLKFVLYIHWLYLHTLYHFSLVLNILQPDAMPVEVAYELRQSCYFVCLQLTRLVSYIYIIYLTNLCVYNALICFTMYIHKPLLWVFCLISLMSSDDSYWFHLLTEMEREFFPVNLTFHLISF